MRRSKKFLSLPVISLADGQQIGTVRRLLLNPEKREVVGLLIEGKGLFKEQKVIPYQRVHHVGDDALTIEKSTCAEKAANLPELVQLVKEKINITGARLVTEKGTRLGIVDEFYIDEKTGKITALVVDGSLFSDLLEGKSLLDASFIRTIGKDFIIVREEAEKNLIPDSRGLKDTWLRVQKLSRSLWEKTREKGGEMLERWKKREPTLLEEDERSQGFKKLCSSGEKNAPADTATGSTDPAGKKEATSNPEEENPEEG